MSAEKEANAAAPGPEMEEDMKDAEDVQAERGEERNSEQEAQSGEQAHVVVVETPQYAEDELGPLMPGTPAGVLTRQLDDVRDMKRPVRNLEPAVLKNHRAIERLEEKMDAGMKDLKRYFEEGIRHLERQANGIWKKTEEKLELLQRKENELKRRPSTPPPGPSKPAPVFEADHMVTSCNTPSFCQYCRLAGREGEASRHHFAFCPYRFPME
ncbi:unnamed protein product [Heligmosomoides polygyrus]|uniref:CCHC-type domain-containing protein n=1 Tax=Heligmosomoides polygyrus TaxID=6339 RepID=A0A183FVX2_HELPZ|nr:unnamed protein product [Heligmosomoides polygyrus]